MSGMWFRDPGRFAFLRAVWKPAEEDLLSIFRRRSSDDGRYRYL